MPNQNKIATIFLSAIKPAETLCKYLFCITRLYSLSPMKKHSLSIVLAAASLFLAGCAMDYRLGTTLSPELCAVYVPTVLNESTQPEAARHLTRELIKEIRREGTLKIVPEQEATTRLDVIITGYEQEAVTYTSNDTQHPNRYRMYLTAKVKFAKIGRNGEPEKVLFEKTNLRGDETFEGGSQSLAFKLRCLPEVAKDLAESIVDACAGAW